jgi:hypothetical protein
VAGGGARHVALHIASCAVVRLGAAARGLRRMRGPAGSAGAPSRARAGRAGRARETDPEEPKEQLGAEGWRRPWLEVEDDLTRGSHV